MHAFYNIPYDIDIIFFPNANLEVISHDALRMRLRRLCEVKAKTGKCHVDQSTHALWKSGGEGREWLEIALTEVLDKLGPSQKNEHKKLRVPSPSILICSIFHIFSLAKFLEMETCHGKFKGSIRLIIIVYPQIHPPHQG